MSEWYSKHTKKDLSDRIEELEDKIEELLSALGKVQAFVKDLEPYADQGTTLHPALYEACMVYERLK